MPRFLLPGLLVLLSANAIAAPAQSTSTPAGCLSHARNILAALENGSYDAAGIVNFNAAMKSAIAAQMNQFWSLLSAHYGGFDRAAHPATRIVNGQPNVTLPLVFARGRENLRVTCNVAGEVVGLFLTPLEAPHNTNHGG